MPTLRRSKLDPSIGNTIHLCALRYVCVRLTAMLIIEAFINVTVTHT